MAECSEERHAPRGRAHPNTTFEDAYRQHLDSLRNIVWRYAPTSADADDLLQEATIKAFTNWDRFDPALAKFTTWFGVIVRNCAIDAYRKAVARPVVGVEQRTMEGVIDPEFGHDQFSSEMHALRAIPYKKAGQVARDALVWLPQEQREVIELEANGMTHMQMETELKEPLGTIKSRIRMAHVRLRKVLGARGVTAETLFGT